MRQYHHLGIPTTEKKEGERYHKNLKFTSTPFGANEYRIQWHRFDDDCELHPILKKVPHVAFKVDDIEAEIEGKHVLFGPYEPLPGYRAAMILTDDGAPIEFIQTDYTDDELAAMEEQTEEINTEGMNNKNE